MYRGLVTSSAKETTGRRVGVVGTVVGRVIILVDSQSQVSPGSRRAVDWSYEASMISCRRSIGRCDQLLLVFRAVLLRPAEEQKAGEEENWRESGEERRSQSATVQFQASPQSTGYLL